MTSDAAVQAKTGKSWQDWFDTLDAKGAQTLTHPQIVALVREQGASPWWSQTVTVTYEQVRLGREKHQMSNGFQVSFSKTIPVTQPILFEAWQNAARREMWLPNAPLQITRMTPEKSIRGAWGDPPSRLDVTFYAKGESGSLVTGQHSRLPNAESASKMKAFWSERMDQLARLLGSD